jgi:hypothetical protein
MKESFDFQKKQNQKLWIVQSCSEVFPRLYCIMHSAPIPDHKRTKKLKTGGESERRGGAQVK